MSQLLCRLKVYSQDPTASATTSFFLAQVMGSMATNGSLHTDTCICDIYCDTDFNETFLALIT